MKKSSPLQEIEKIARGDKQFQKELIESIIRQTTKQVMQMKFCVQRND